MSEQPRMKQPTANKHQPTIYRQRFPYLCLVLLVVGVVTLSACTGRATPVVAHTIPGGDAQRGWQLLQDYGCHTCHTIPGVPGAHATVGPPLDDWAHRHYIAGLLPNNPENLILWIQFPQSVSPGNVMPDQGVSEQEARDIGAYLYTLRRTGWNWFARSR